jgi:hypothetical protein
MSRIDDLLQAGLRSLSEWPAEKADRAVKQAYSQRMSQVIANALAEELRHRGMTTALPAPPGTVGISGAERRLSGGIGAKRVDATWATEESGLILGLSVKTINWRDSRSNNFQKNLTNRRGDMLFESVTLHRRFPYAVLGGFFFLDSDAESDHTAKRRSTWVNAHQRLRLFTRRPDPAGREEQLERLYLVSVKATQFAAELKVREVGRPDDELSFDAILNDLVTLVVERNFDFYEIDADGKIVTV